MKIGIVGAGAIGGTAARLFVEAGHEVALSNSRGPESLREQVAELGPAARAMTVDDAAEWGEVVLLAVPWRSPEALPHADRVAGRVVVDAMNPYRPDFGLFELGDSTSSEETLKRFPRAWLVKAFNTIRAGHLAERGRPDLPVDERHAVFVAGDDAEAKALVSRLVEEIGFAPVDTGGLREGGRMQEPRSPLYDRAMTGREARAAVAALAGGGAAA